MWTGRRQTRLEKQLAETRFPGGVAVPSGIGLALSLLLAVFCAWYLQRPATPAVPAAVIESQERLVASVTHTLAASVAGNVTDLRVTVTQSAAKFARNSGDVLGELGELYPQWRGLALVDGPGNRMVAARGEPVPLDQLDRTSLQVATVRPVARPGHGVLLVATVPLGGSAPGRLLVASTDLRSPEFFTDERLGQSVLLVTADGTVVDSQGLVPDPDDRALHTLIRTAAAAATAGQTGSKVDAVPRDASVQGTTAAGHGADGAAVPVVAYAPLTVADMSGTLGLGLVSVIHAPVEHGDSAGHSLVPATALVVVAVLGFLLIRVAFVRPVRRLRTDAIAVASGNLGRNVRISRVTEVRRIAVAIEHCRARLRGEFARPRARRAPAPTARLVIVLSTVALLAWSAFVILIMGVPVPAVPETVIRERGTEVARVADSVRGALDAGMAELKVLSRLSAANDDAALETSMAQLVARESRYRSVYLVDMAGQPIVHTGRPPLRPAERLPDDQDAVYQYNTSGRLPVIFAYRSLPDRKRAVMAEFDVERISGLLRQAAGRIRIVDSGLRTIADTEGYMAFQELSDDSLRRSAGVVGSGTPRAQVVDSPTGPAVVASAAIGGSRSAAMLGWVVVADQPVTALNLPGNELRRRALVSGLLGMAIALLQCGWHELIFVRPLRRTAAAGERLVAGDTTAAIYPVRQDHIGTVTSCLEICRQALADGVHRLGDVRRPPGRPFAIRGRVRRSTPNSPKHALIRRES